MRRLILAVLIGLAALAVALVAAQGEPGAEASGNIVLPESVFVRSAPQLESSIPIGALFAGDRVTPLYRSEDGQWVLIAYRRSTGWIQRNLVAWQTSIDALPVLEGNLTPTSSAAEIEPIPFPTETPIGNFVDVAATRAFVRAGPGQIFPRIGQLLVGQIVEPVGRNADTSWILIRYRDEDAEFEGFAWILRTLVRWEQPDTLSELPVLELDNLTPTLTFTPSLTPSNTATDTPTATDTATPTPSDTPTATDTVTPSVTPSTTPSETATATDTVTPSVTPSSTPSETATATDTVTPSVTPSTTPSETATATDTLTPSVTPSETATATDTVTPSVTPSSTPSETPTVTDTATNTRVPTETATPSNTPTSTPTETDTPAPSDTPSPDATDIARAIAADASATAAARVTDTPEPTETLTSTPEPTETLTNTPEPTETATDTPAPTETLTNTPEPTETATDTPAPTETATDTVEPTETASDTPAPTETPEATEEATDEVIVYVTPGQETTSVAPLPVTAVPPTTDGPDTPASSRPLLPPEAIIGLGIFVLVLIYVGLYVQGLNAAARYRDGFIIERCPVCQRGHLTVELRQERWMGLPSGRHTVRCDECRSVLREIGPRRWRYAVDRIENPSFYERFNNREVSEMVLRQIGLQTPRPSTSSEAAEPKNPET